MEIEQMARQVLEPLGYEVLEVTHHAGQGSSTVTVRIDRLDEQPVATKDLERASGVLGLELDRLDPISGVYKLDLESPGPKRPLLRARHFERMAGLKIKVKRPGNSVIGKIIQVLPSLGNEGSVTLELDGGQLETIEIAGIRANLAEWPKEHR